MRYYNLIKVLASAAMLMYGAKHTEWWTYVLFMIGGFILGGVAHDADRLAQLEREDKA